MPTDLELLQRTCRGEDAPARELWSRFGPRLTAFAASLLRRDGGREAADDVVQAVFYRVIRTDRHTIAAVQDVAAWLARAIRNEALNHIRGRGVARHSAAGISLLPRSGGPPSGPHSPEAPAGFDDLHEALDSIPESLREVVLLKHVAGLTFDQIAISLDENRNTVASRYTKAMQLLLSLIHI